ncbi:MAG: hypothetical protein IKW30_09945 [Lachnospiraceae bacterium]|nr:hypothetical protein [Lachnospiraceae bacterium]
MIEKKQKNWFWITLITTVSILIMIMLTMVIVDPYFHFHGPLNGIKYRLYTERYMNSGIARNFEYDTVITGSSMNQNFKTSLMDELFGTKAIKIPFSGAGFEEIKNTLEVALNSKNDIKYVLWGLDYNGLNREYDFQGYNEYPDYLYDNNPFNDTSYVFNKTILFEGLLNTFFYNLSGEETTSFDDYSSWDAPGGWESIHRTYRRSGEILPIEEISEEERERVTKNIMENIVKLAQAYPDTQFLLFYTPYSALYWESIYRDGWLDKQLEMEKIATELMLECKNIKLYSFCQETHITDDIMNYRDKEHYLKDINDMILQWIAEGKGLVTKENYMDKIQWEKEYYQNFDYDKLYVGNEQYKEPWQ